ncbi:MAG: TIR domain-containing protein, partial [Pyrinomonadaceae bacterium]|nr:TIR domain-containing protein [Pyrinomonadaceae bacterium]
HEVFSPSARDEIVNWRNSFLYYLVEKGTQQSVEQITRIKNELPHLERVKQLELNAIEKMREKNWQPFSSQKLLKIFMGLEEKDNNMGEEQKEYDVALSFAGEQREIVELIAKLLKERNVKVFYDNYEKSRLLGKDLYIELADIYSNRSKFVIIFVSKEYKDKIWTNHEIRNAFERAIEQDGYIIPARLDDTEITGLRKTIGYTDLRKESPFSFVEMIVEKLSENQ